MAPHKVKLRKKVPLMATPQDWATLQREMSAGMLTYPNNYQLDNIVHPDHQHLGPQFSDPQLSIARTIPMEQFYTKHEIDDLEPMPLQYSQFLGHRPGSTQQYKTQMTLLRLAIFQKGTLDHSEIHNSLSAIFQDDSTDDGAINLVKKVSAANDQVRADMVKKGLKPCTFRLLTDPGGAFLNVSMATLHNKDEFIALIESELQTCRCSWMVPYIVTMSVGQLVNIPFLYNIHPPNISNIVHRQAMIQLKADMTTNFLKRIARLIYYTWLHFIDHDPQVPQDFKPLAGDTHKSRTDFNNDWKGLNYDPAIMPTNRKREEWPGYEELPPSRKRLWRKLCA